MADLTKPIKRAQKKSAKKSAKQADLTERRHLVLELRKQGATYRQIADQLVEEFGKSGEHDITKKYSHTAAYDDFKIIIKELNERNVDEAEEMRRVDLERMEAMFSGFFNRAVDGDTFAFDKAMDIIRQHASMFGYNAPIKQEVTGKDGAPLQSQQPVLNVILHGTGSPPEADDSSPKPS